MAPQPRAPTVLALVVVSSVWQTATALNASLRVSNALGMIREAYTTNAICGKKNCINPIFPGMEDLHRLQQAKWITSSLQKTSEHMGFCRNAVSYDPALPVPEGGSAAVKQLVQRQDNAASTMFYYHLSGLGLEAWDYQKPEYANDCIKSIWRMVCFTYFPRAEVGAQDGAWSQYIRPCKSSCENYVRACGVECCDESVQCVFQHTKAISPTQKVTSEGYIPHDGPSSLCTGAAQRSAKPFGAIFWTVVVLIMAVSLQGCDYDIPTHKVGNWRGQTDYLIKNEFIPPGGSAKSANLNSCSLSHLSQTLQCSGRGVCKLWDPKNIDNQLAFCECDKNWADPECRTRRKSQTIAYLFALFFGFLGADQFYLGHIGPAIVKLCSFGGFGVLWVMDIVKIGSAPVYTTSFRTAADLPHFVFVLSATMFAVFVGFLIAYCVTIVFRIKRRKEALLLQMDEEKRQMGEVAANNLTKAKAYGSMGPMGPMGSMMPPTGMPTMMPGSMPMMNPFGSGMMRP